MNPGRSPRVTPAAVRCTTTKEQPMNYSPCPTCGSEELYWSQSVTGTSANTATDYPGVQTGIRGGISLAGTFRLLMCADCGLTRFYADPVTTKKLAGSFRWKRHTSDEE